MAMKPFNDKSLLWNLAEGGSSKWLDSFMEIVDHACNNYEADPHLFLWDLVCNVVVASCSDAYSSVCVHSHINPANYEHVAMRFLEGVSDALAKASHATSLPRHCHVTDPLANPSPRSWRTTAALASWGWHSGSRSGRRTGRSR